jgi:hypothetical protein
LTITAKVIQILFPILVAYGGVQFRLVELQQSTMTPHLSKSAFAAASTAKLPFKVTETGVCVGLISWI